MFAADADSKYRARSRSCLSDRRPQHFNSQLTYHARFLQRLIAGDVCKTDLRYVQLDLIRPVGTGDGVSASVREKAKQWGIRLFHTVLEPERVS